MSEDSSASTFLLEFQQAQNKSQAKELEFEKEVAKHMHTRHELKNFKDNFVKLQNEKNQLLLDIHDLTTDCGAKEKGHKESQAEVAEKESEIKILETKLTMEKAGVEDCRKNYETQYKMISARSMELINQLESKYIPGELLSEMNAAAGSLRSLDTNIVSNEKTAHSQESGESPSPPATADEESTAKPCDPPPAGTESCEDPHELSWEKRLHEKVENAKLPALQIELQDLDSDISDIRKAVPELTSYIEQVKGRTEDYGMKVDEVEAVMRECANCSPKLA